MRFQEPPHLTHHSLAALLDERSGLLGPFLRLVLFPCPAWYSRVECREGSRVNVPVNKANADR